MTVAEKIQAERGLADRLGAYAGQWVAVASHDVTYSSPTLEALLEQIPKESIETTTVFQVPQDGTSACYF